MGLTTQGVNPPLQKPTTCCDADAAKSYSHVRILPKYTTPPISVPPGGNGVGAPEVPEVAVAEIILIRTRILSMAGAKDCSLKKAKILREPAREF